MVSTFCAHIFPIESAFEYLYHLKPENHSSVTFSENQMSYNRDFPVEWVISRGLFDKASLMHQTRFNQSSVMTKQRGKPRSLKK